MMAISVSGTSKFSAEFLRRKKNGKPRRCVWGGGVGQGVEGQPPFFQSVRDSETT